MLFYVGGDGRREAERAQLGKVSVTGTQLVTHVPFLLSESFSSLWYLITDFTNCLPSVSTFLVCLFLELQPLLVCVFGIFVFLLMSSSASSFMVCLYAVHLNRSGSSSTSVSFPP